jgi:hypothetical protein
LSLQTSQQSTDARGYGPIPVRAELRLTENSPQRFESRSPHQAAGHTTLLQPAPPIDPNFRRRDVHPVEMRLHPFDDRSCSTCRPCAGRLVEGGIREADLRPAEGCRRSSCGRCLSGIGSSDARSIINQGERSGFLRTAGAKHPVVGWMDAAHLPSRLLVDPLAEPDAWSASVLVDELDAGRFESVPNRQVISRIH